MLKQLRKHLKKNRKLLKRGQDTVNTKTRKPDPMTKSSKEKAKE